MMQWIASGFEVIVGRHCLVFFCCCCFCEMHQCSQLRQNGLQFGFEVIVGRHWGEAAGPQDCLQGGLVLEVFPKMSLLKIWMQFQWHPLTELRSESKLLDGQAITRQPYQPIQNLTKPYKTLPNHTNLTKPYKSKQNQTTPQ